MVTICPRYKGSGQNFLIAVMAVLKTTSPPVSPLPRHLKLRPSNQGSIGKRKNAFFHSHFPRIRTARAQGQQRDTSPIIRDIQHPYRFVAAERTPQRRYGFPRVLPFGGKGLAPAGGRPEDAAQT